MASQNPEWRKKKALYFVPSYGGRHAGVDFVLTGSKKRGYRVSCGGWYDGFVGINCEFSEEDRRDLIELLQMADNSAPEDNDARPA